jgi:hypothetical protein
MTQEQADSREPAGQAVEATPTQTSSPRLNSAATAGVPRLLIFVGSIFFAIVVNVINLRLLGGHVHSEWGFLAGAGIAFLFLLTKTADRNAAIELRWVSVSFGVGVLAGAAARHHYGPHPAFPVTAFCTAVTPIVAAMFLGMVLVETAKEHRMQKALGLLYLVMGAVATALGTVPSQSLGWLYGVCYLVVCGSLGSSAFVVLSIAKTLQ